jgi:hypothetical protein
MEDKRQLANDELKPTMDGGILALSPVSSENYVELPPTAPIESEQVGTVVNNFNVNLNVSGKTNSTVREVTNTLQNALPAVSQSPDVKKNSTEISAPNSIEVEPSRVSTELKALTNSEEAIPDNLEIFQLAEEGIDPTPALDLAGLDIFDVPDYAKYEYSISNTKEQDPKLKQSYEILKNVTEHSISSQSEPLNTSPYSSIDASMYVDQFNTNKSYSIQNLQVENSFNSPVENANEAVRRRDRMETAQSVQTERTVNQIQRDAQSTNQELGDIEEATLVSSKSGLTPPSTPKLARTTKNINSTPSTISMFTNKMSSPPIWRTALG